MIASWKRHLSEPTPKRGFVIGDGGWRWILGAILGIGVLLRGAQYWACRSLWLDEASLALNFFDDSFIKCLLPFGNHQAAPAGFNLLTAFLVRIAGISEWSLRFLPLVSGITSIFVFWRLSRRWLQAESLVLANYAFAISSTLVYYSNEFKPYGLDALLGMLVLWAVLAWWEEGNPPGRLPGLAILGALAVWFSFPVVFIMAGAGGVVLAACWRYQRRSALRELAAVAGVWLIAFACQYLLVGRHLSQLTDLTEYWREAGAFMPFPPWKPGGRRWLASGFLAYFQDVAGLHHTRNLFAFFFLSGVAELVRERAFVRLGALLTPFVLVLVASVFEQYPFQGRLALFTVPLVLLICGEGVKALVARIRHPILGYAMLAVAVLAPSAYTLPQLWRPVQIEEVRPLVAFLGREAGARDLILLFNDNSSFALYARLQRLKQTAVPFKEQDLPAMRLRITQELEGGRRCWLLISHATDAQQAAIFSQFQPGFRLRPADLQVGAQLFVIEPS
jgi:hypothetical protein